MADEAGKEKEVAQAAKPAGTGEATPGLVAPTAPPAEDSEKLRAELEQSKQRQSGWDKAMGRLLERQEKLDKRLDQMLGLVAQGNASPAEKQRQERLELELAQLKDMIKEQQGATEDGTVPTYEQQLLQRRQADEAAEKQRWDAQVATTREAIEDDLHEAGVPLEALSRDPQFLSLWSSGQLREARQRAKAFVVAMRVPAPRTAEPVATEEPPETEQEHIERLTNERLQAELKKRGLLLNDKGGGGGQNWEEVRAAYIQNPRDPQVRQRYLQMRGERRGT